jgi:hypothetical protein
MASMGRRDHWDGIPFVDTSCYPAPPARHVCNHTKKYTSFYVEVVKFVSNFKNYTSKSALILSFRREISLLNAVTDLILYLFLYSTDAFFPASLILKCLHIDRVRNFILACNDELPSNICKWQCFM